MFFEEKRILEMLQNKSEGEKKFAHQLRKLNRGFVIPAAGILCFSFGSCAPAVNVPSTLAASFAAYLASLKTLIIAGTVQSTSGGFTFPDGTTQTTASSQLGYIVIQEEKSSGTFPTGSCVNNVWVQRAVNALAVDTTGLASVGLGTFVLPAGIYRTRIKVPGGGGANNFRGRLFNTTDNSIILTGSSESGGAATSGNSWITGRFTLSSSKTLEIDQVCSVTNAATFGFPTAVGVNEIYTVAEFWKE
jgi:hypothetical protein